jgi:hypothetical protein
VGDRGRAWRETKRCAAERVVMSVEDEWEMERWSCQVWMEVECASVEEACSWPSLPIRR